MAPKNKITIQNGQSENILRLSQYMSSIVLYVFKALRLFLIKNKLKLILGTLIVTFVEFIISITA
ncbi:hypothetical protein MHTCC0001_15990 [Flavobacteriaceae bacterium MHTCC 0001]